MASVMKLGGEGGEIELRVLRYERPEVTEGPDANWLVSEVTAAVDGFRAHVRAAIDSRDIAAFSDELASALAGARESAVLETDEEQIRVRVNLHRTGRAEVLAELGSGARCPGGLLRVRFESDQTFVSALARSVASVLDSYPIRGRL